jgi:hypothetical protein
MLKQLTAKPDLGDSQVTDTEVKAEEIKPDVEQG